MDKERLKAEEKKRLTLARIESENFMKHGPPDLTKLYRPYSMNMSKNWNHENRILFKEIDFESKSLISSRGTAFADLAESEGRVITFRARIHTLRRMSAKLVFIVFRQQTMTIQGVLQSFREPEKGGRTIYLQKEGPANKCRQRTKWHNFRKHGAEC